MNSPYTIQTPKRNSLDVLRERMEEFYNLHEYDRAESVAEHILTLDPTNYHALYVQARVAIQQNKLSLATMWCKRILESHNDVATHNMLGDLYRNNNNLQNAVKSYKDAISAAPDDASGYYNLGDLYLDVGNLDGSESNLRKAITLSPKDAKIRAKLAKTLIQSNDPTAVNEMLSAIEVSPESPDLYNDMGVIFSIMGKFPSAATYFNMAIKLKEDNTKAAVNLSKTMKFTKMDENFDAIYDVYRKYNPRNVEQASEIYFALGKVHDDLGNHTQAFTYYTKANKPREDTAKAHVSQELEEIKKIKKVFTQDWVEENRTNLNDMPIFVVGSPRSGTSLVERCLASHPVIHGMGETNVMPRIIAETKFLTSKDYPESIFELSKSQIKDLAVKALSYMNVIADTNVRVDKLPSNFKHVGLINAMFPHARIIYCDRNIMDTALSVYFSNFSSGNEWSYDLPSIGRKIMAIDDLMEYWTDYFGIMRVRYEALVEGPRPMIENMLMHVGVPWNDACLEPHKNKSYVHTSSVWQVRQKINTNSVFKHKRYERFLGPLRDAINSTIEDELEDPMEDVSNGDTA